MKYRLHNNIFLYIEDKYDSDGHIIPWHKIKKEIGFTEENKMKAIDAEFEVKE